MSFFQLWRKAKLFSTAAGLALRSYVCTYLFFSAAVTALSKTAAKTFFNKLVVVECLPSRSSKVSAFHQPSHGFDYCACVRARACVCVCVCGCLCHVMCFGFFHNIIFHFGFCVPVARTLAAGFVCCCFLPAIWLTHGMVAFLPHSVCSRLLRTSLA